MRKFLFSFVLLFVISGIIFSQDGLGDFGFPSFSDGSSASFSVSIGGDVKAHLSGFFDDMGSTEKIKSIRLGDIFSGSLCFEVSSNAAEGFIKLNLTPVFPNSNESGVSPIEIDEAYVRAFFGPVTVLGGLRKLTWGKADSFGPLDLINPIDYRDLTKLSNPQSVKIPRPMLHFGWAPGAFTKLETVFIPWFQGHKFATEGRWTPLQIRSLQALGVSSIDFDPDTYTLEYAQAGTRLSTSFSSSDFGFQYYFGRLPRPAIILRMTPAPLPEPEYNYYHHFGADFARVIAGFNLRAEAGANVTSDLDGTDGTVENPSLVWSLGFDRDFSGITYNIQGQGRFRLFHDKIGGSLMEDCEAGTDLTSSRITGVISKKFLKDELELKITALWGIEDKDFLAMPSITWSRNDVQVELSCGFFGGDKEGELGQYRDNNFVKLGLSYSF